MPTKQQDKLFSDALKGSIEDGELDNYALDYAIEWINKNLDPDVVFDVSNLETWAENNGYYKTE